MPTWGTICANYFVRVHHIVTIPPLINVGLHSTEGRIKMMGAVGVSVYSVAILLWASNGHSVAGGNYLLVI